jgi:DNA-binding NtrC family response regulator
MGGVRAMVEHNLLAEGYAFEVAETVSEACRLIASRSHDLVLTDVLLPDGSGVAVANCAVERRFGVLIVTGYAFQIPVAELDRHEYVLKPVRRAELLRAVERRMATDA